MIYFTVDQAGAATAPNVIAITNPYSTCPGNAGGTTPTVKFALRLTSGTATSAVPSLDGTVLYVLESRASSTHPARHQRQQHHDDAGHLQLRHQRWTSVHTLSSSPIGTATSEQLFQLTFATAVNNVSSPYLDYSSNQIFFGDSAGKIHRVINTNLSTASEYLSNGFPVACGTAQLTSPVFANDQVIVDQRQRLRSTGSTWARRPTRDPLGAGRHGRRRGRRTVGAGDRHHQQQDHRDRRARPSAAPVKGIGAFDLMFAAGAVATSGCARAPTTVCVEPPTFDDAFWSTNNGNRLRDGRTRPAAATPI